MSRARKQVLNFISTLPPRQTFTSGTVTEFIRERTTLLDAWENIREENIVTRVSDVRGKATEWKRSRKFNKALQAVS